MASGAGAASRCPAQRREVPIARPRRHTRGPDAVPAQPVAVTHVGARQFRGFEPREARLPGGADHDVVDAFEPVCSVVGHPSGDPALTDLASSLAASDREASNDLGPRVARLHVGRTPTSRRPLAIAIVTSVLVLAAIVKPWSWLSTSAAGAPPAASLAAPSAVASPAAVSRGPRRQTLAGDVAYAGGSTGSQPGLSTAGIGGADGPAGAGTSETTGSSSSAQAGPRPGRRRHRRPARGGPGMRAHLDVG